MLKWLRYYGILIINKASKWDQKRAGSSSRSQDLDWDLKYCRSRSRDLDWDLKCLKYWELQVSNILDWVFQIWSAPRPNILDIEISRNTVAPRPNILDWDLKKYGRSTSQYSGLRSPKIRSLHVPIFWILRSQKIRSLHVPILWIEISNTIAPGLKIWFFLFWDPKLLTSMGNILRIQFLGTSWEHFLFWELHGNISYFGNFMGTFAILGTSWEHLLSLESC